MGLVVWVGMFDLPHTKVHVNGYTKNVHLPVQLCNFDQQPHKIGAPGGCGIISVPNWNKRDSESIEDTKRTQCEVRTRINLDFRLANMYVYLLKVEQHARPVHLFDCVQSA